MQIRHRNSNFRQPGQYFHTKLLAMATRQSTAATRLDGVIIVRMVNLSFKITVHLFFCGNNLPRFSKASVSIFKTQYVKLTDNCRCDLGLGECISGN